ncbi:MAG TPA: helix-turn-helix domain-containing protein [Herbaspirillum sp.]|jgi:DNA-binding IclR family transcriptional regulator
MTLNVKSAKRLIDLLEYFADRRSSATAAEITADLGLPQSSTSILLRSLVELGYLSFEPQARKFKPTIRVSLLGSWLLNDTSLPVSPLSIMEALHAETGDTIVLGAQNGNQVNYIHVLQATTPIRFYIKPGSLRPLCLTAMGRALLAPQSDRKISGIVRQINAERKEGEPLFKESEVIQEVRTGHNRGYHVSWGRATPGAAVIAMLLPAIGDHPRLALGIGGPIERIRQNENRYIALMKNIIGDDDIRNDTRIEAPKTAIRKKPA